MELGLRHRGAFSIAWQIVKVKKTVSVEGQCLTNGNVVIPKLKCRFVSLGEQDGYNIPKITACQDLQQWLTDEGYEDLKKYHTDGGLHQSKPPNYVNRLLNDVYLCMYRSRDASMYK